jgi:cytochrome c oxidase subunit I
MNTTTTIAPTVIAPPVKNRTTPPVSDYIMPVSKSEKWLVLLQLSLPMVLLIIGIWGGLMQVLFRAGVIQEDLVITLLRFVHILPADYVMADGYYRGLTLHGVVNALVFTTFFAVAFGNVLIPYALRKSLHIRVAWISCIVMIVGTLMAAGAIIMGEASVLYTFYPPLKAHWTFYAGATLLVVGSWIAFAGWVPLYLSWRRENIAMSGGNKANVVKTPLAVVGMFTTFIVWVMATLPLAVETLFLLLPWSLGITPDINATLARTLFWFFGHALVYFWLLPAYTMYYTMLPRLAGGQLFSDRAARIVFMTFVVLSVPIGAHHQFADPAIGSNWKLLQSFFTAAVAIPSFMTAFSMAVSLEQGAKRHRGAHGLFDWLWKQPFFEPQRFLFAYLVAGLVIFIFGGITGIMNSSYALNVAVHNTAWMPGHFHMTVAGPVFLAFLGMSLMLLLQLGGKDLKLPRLAVAIPYIWMAGLFLFSYNMMQGGLHGEPRRTNLGATYMNPDSPMYRADWAVSVKLTMVGGSIMFAAILLYFVVFFTTALSKKVRQEAVIMPLSDALHDEPAGVFATFRPWIALGLFLCATNYTPVFMDVARGVFQKSPAYSPFSSVPLNQSIPAGAKAGMKAGTKESTQAITLPDSIPK